MLNRYLIYGLGLPILVDAVSPEAAEAYLIESLRPAPDVGQLFTRKIAEVPSA